MQIELEIELFCMTASECWFLSSKSTPRQNGFQHHVGVHYEPNWSPKRMLLRPKH